MIKQQTAVNRLKQQPESKGDRFKRLVPKRVDRVINGLRQIGNCSVLSSYDYTDGQVQQIFDAVEKAMEEARVRFNLAASKNGSEGFQFE